MKRIATVVACWFASVAAAQTVVYGITIGEHAPWQECPRVAGDPLMYDSGAKEPCLRNILARATLERDKGLYVWFPYGQQPAHSATQEVQVILVGERVEGIIVTTGGLKTQSNVLSDLTAKFGNPANVSKRPMQNRMGAKFDALDAVWSLPDRTTVMFYGMMSNIDRGSILVASPAGQAELDARIERGKAAKGKPL